MPVWLSWDALQSGSGMILTTVVDSFAANILSLHW
jgi:hypothetical protein